MSARRCCRKNPRVKRACWFIARRERHSAFVIRASFDIRHLSFVIRPGRLGSASVNFDADDFQDALQIGIVEKADFQSAFALAVA